VREENVAAAARSDAALSNLIARLRPGIQVSAIRPEESK
jgi:hypothetical protein